MQIDVNGTRLWFDVDGAALVPDGPLMRQRPTLILLHGGPANYDHSYLKSAIAPSSVGAQVVYLDLRDHGRSARDDPAGWSFELCADDLRAFCDALGIDRPIVLGHSMGGIIAMLHGVRHPGHAGALILLSTLARFDLERLVDGFRQVAGDEIAELARRDYGGDPVTDDEWARVFAAFGPRVLGEDDRARRIRNPAVNAVGIEQLRGLDITDQLGRITEPTLVCVGDRDPVTPVAASQEIVAALAPGIGRLEVLHGAGHFAWLDAPDELGAIVSGFVRDVALAPV